MEWGLGIGDWGLEIEIEMGPEGQKQKNLAIFEYLKESAKEGYVQAMYTLGNEYLKGELCSKNYTKALAWHRQASRNGYILSYEVCGDIFYTGGPGLKQNKSLALIMYFSAYTNGILYLKDKIMNISEELKIQGEPLPEMVLL